MRERGRMFVAQADKAFLQEWADEVSGRFSEWITPDHFLSVIVDELRQVRSQSDLFSEVPSRIERAALRLAREDRADSDRRGEHYTQSHREAQKNQASRVEPDEAHHQAVATRELIAYRAMERLRGKVPPAMLDKLLSHVEAAMGDKVLAMSESEIRALVHHKLADIERLRAERDGPLTPEAQEQLEVAHGELLMLRVMEGILTERRAA